MKFPNRIGRCRIVRPVPSPGQPRSASSLAPREQQTKVNGHAGNGAAREPGQDIDRQVEVLRDRAGR